MSLLVEHLIQIEAISFRFFFRKSVATAARGTFFIRSRSTVLLVLRVA